jgi:hypothetical protein
MAVPLFKLAMAGLLRTHSPVSLFVGPDWLELDHQGSISDQFYPGTELACPYLGQDSVVRVRRQVIPETPEADTFDDFQVLPVTEVPVVDERAPKRPRGNAETSSSVDAEESDGELVKVTPRERKLLLQRFKREARLSRVAYQRRGRSSTSGTIITCSRKS